MLRFFNDIRGNITLMFAAGAGVLAVLIGGGMELSRLESARAHTQDAADAAVLAATIAAQDTQNLKKLRGVADQVFKANLQARSDIHVSKGELTKHGSGFKYAAEASLDGSMLEMLGMDDLDLSVEAWSATSGGQALELAIAMDVTNSMGFGSRWEDAKDALEDMLEALEDHSGRADFHVSLIPTTDRVNIGTGRIAWLDGPAPSGWNGCVEPREKKHGPYDYAMDDHTAKSKPFKASHNLTGGLWTRGTPACVTTPITGPTSDVDEIMDAVDDLYKSGTGRPDEGLAWAWRLLSPKWRDDWDVSGYPAKAKDARKVAVLITDGNTTAYDVEVGADTSLGWNMGTELAFEHMEYMCSRMKKDGIEIYMFQMSGNPHFTPYAKDCASTDAHYIMVEGEIELADAFAALGRQVGDIRLAR